MSNLFFLFYFLSFTPSFSIGIRCTFQKYRAAVFFKGQSGKYCHTRFYMSEMEFGAEGH